MEYADQFLYILYCRSLVERDSNAVIEIAKIDLRRQRFLLDRCYCVRLDAERVEEMLVLRCKSDFGKTIRKQYRHRMHALGDIAKTFRAMIDGIHRGDIREQCLRRADIARGLVSADMLLARLQRHAIG